MKYTFSSSAELSPVHCIEGLVLGSYLSIFQVIVRFWVGFFWCLIHILESEFSISIWLGHGAHQYALCRLWDLFASSSAVDGSVQSSSGSLWLYMKLSTHSAAAQPLLKGLVEIPERQCQAPSFPVDRGTISLFLPLCYQQWFASADILPPSASQP